MRKNSDVYDCTGCAMCFEKDNTHEGLENNNKLTYDEEKFFDVFFDCIFIFRENKIIYANDKAVKLVECSNLTDIIGKDLHSILMCYKNNKNIINKIQKQLEKEKNIFTTELKLERKDSEKLYLKIKTTPYLFKNRPSILVVMHNITDEKKAEIKAREKENWYKQLINLLPDALFITREENLIFSNKSGLKLLGTKKLNDILGKNIKEFSCSEEMDTFEKRKRMLYGEKKKVISTDYRLLRKNGRIVNVELVSIPFIYNNKFSIITIAHDITEKKKSQEKEKRLEKVIEIDNLKTEFFSNVSHELKTPLNIILASIQLIDSIHASIQTCHNYDKVNKYINSMRQNCYRLLKLINNLIDINKIESGYLNMNFSNHNIISVVEDITLSISEYTQSKGINLIFDTDIEEKIMAIDRDKIERVILNLLSNAVKFTNSGGSILVNIQDRTNSLYISVKDTGIGIPKHMLGKIFNRFEQVNSSLIKNYGGSGIGLSLVKSIIEAHGGIIRAESDYGSGSKFIIELPVRLPKKGNDNPIEKMILEEKNSEKVNIEFSDISP